MLHRRYRQTNEPSTMTFAYTVDNKTVMDCMIVQSRYPRTHSNIDLHSRPTQSPLCLSYLCPRHSLTRTPSEANLGSGGISPISSNTAPSDTELHLNRRHPKKCRNMSKNRRERIIKLQSNWESGGCTQHRKRSL